MRLCYALGLALASLAAGKALRPQTNTFNSNFTLSDAQTASLNLSAVSANNVNVAAQFERTNWATGSVAQDTFYTDLPANATSAPAGSLLKVEAFVNTSDYTIAPTLALSRFIYQSKTLNGTRVPVSAYVLWPYLPLGGADKAPLVSWGHGTSGIFAECAPSHVRNLWYQFSAPYALAQAGYAVVGTDYAGLGVSRYPDASPIVHQYLGGPAAGNDILYAAQAAHAAFPDKLTQEFVVMGHSQGGGAAWAAAEQQVEVKVPGYLGSIVGSPAARPLEVQTKPSKSLGLIQTAKGIQSVFPDLPLSDMLTPEGEKLINLTEDIQGCNSVLQTLLDEVLNTGVTLTKDSFLDSAYAKQWTQLSKSGGKDYTGPLLVLQGTADPAIPVSLVDKAVNETCEKFPHKSLHYVKAAEVGHVPVLDATHQIWLRWLEDRFRSAHHHSGIADRGGRGKCTRQEIGSTAPMPLDHYQPDLNYFLEFAVDMYQVA